MNKRYTKELIEEAVNKSINWAEVCRILDITPATGAQCHVKKRADDFKVDYSHFLGKASNRGKEFKKKNALEYCFNGSTENSDRLRKRLIRDGYKKKECEICKLNEWQGEEIVLELDHIDSNHYNNDLYNLQILCPNCHALETRKRKRPCDGTR